MKIVYIAHPISGDVDGNLNKIAEIYKMITNCYPDVVPFVPYFVTCKALDDIDPFQRNKGILHNMEFFNRGIIDEVWLFGNRISEGMKYEIRVAEELNIPIVDKTTPLFP